MADAVSESDLQAVKPPPKRRRILDPSAIVPVPVYSNKVSSSLQLKPMAAVFTEKENADDGADESLWSRFSSRGPTASSAPAVITFSDSDDDEAEDVENKPERLEKRTEPEAIRSPSPPPPESPVQKQSRQVKQKISEIDRKLRAVNSLLSPEPHQRSRPRRGLPSPDDDDDDVIVMNHTDDDVVVMSPTDDDVIVMHPNPGLQDSPYSSSAREIPLKIRCRTDVHKVPVLPSTALRDVVTQLSVILNVPPPRLLLMRDEVELPTHSTVRELGLGIADIIECVVMAAEDKDGADDSSSSSSFISVRLQSKDRDSSQEFSLHRDAPLDSIFSQYLSKMSAGAQRQVRFQFDGSKVTPFQTPAQLDMEDGDIIEVWI
ncbi:NFATC2-interacting protein-like isoform X2 [Micropterus dolomieu]|uniref:NFATC2-interacting protein-like isoform X2 n=1 Tax=Micropterus dolomieu TaxID=147949 RepID=UPI001E8D339A|nr:NFATC2-interacting protein-like isoform X2 [Micropterus dolomieu]